MAFVEPKEEEDKPEVETIVWCISLENGALLFNVESIVPSTISLTLGLKAQVC